MALRSYQEHDIQAVGTLMERGEDNALLVQPTGAGKGYEETWMASKMVSNGARVLCLVNRIGLVLDKVGRFRGDGLDPGIIMSGYARDFRKSCQVASIDTIHRMKELPPADVLFIDEAHFCTSKIWAKVFEQYRQAFRLGMTATPIGPGGRSLGSVFTNLVLGPTIRELQDDGFLVRTKVYAPTKPDMSKVSKVAGDYNEDQTAEVMMGPSTKGRTITGDIVEHWLKLANGVATVAFCVNKAHSRFVCNAFMKAGIAAEHVDCDTSTDERENVWTRLREGITKVVTSVGIISYGWNEPCVGCAILAAPTWSLQKYLQQVGRVLRTFPGKLFALILDHAGNTQRHGRVEVEHEWSLEDVSIEVRQKEAAEPGMKTCEKCFNVYVGQKCPNCGESAPGPPPVEVARGLLVEMAEVERWFKCRGCGFRNTIGQTPYAAFRCPRCGAGDVLRLKSKYDTGEDPVALYKRLVAECNERGYKPGWAKMNFHRITKSWPRKEWASL